MDELDCKAKIFYYFRGKYYNLMLSACKEGISKFKNDISFHLYHALALILINRLEEGIHELEPIRSESDIRLAVTIALMYGHKLAGVTNKDLFVKLDTQMREYRKAASAVDFYHSAVVLVTLNKLEKSLDYIDKALNMHSTLSECLTLKGWVLLQLLRVSQKSISSPKDIFRSALQENSKNLDAILGLSECHLINNEIEEALNVINKAVVRFQSLNLPLIQKMKIHFAAQDWEQTVETIHRICINDPDNLETRKTNILILICQEAQYEEAVSNIKKLVNDIETHETNNSQILLDNSQLFSKICNRNPDILNETFKMLELAVQINSDSVEIIVELGYQSLLRAKIKDAQRYFRTATKIDDTSLYALIGLSLCELSENGKSDQLKKQINFLSDMKDAHKSAVLYFLRAKIAESSEEALSLLKEVCDIQLNKVKSCPFSDSYLLLLDPDLMLDVVKEYLQYTSSDISLKKSSGSSDKALNAAHDTLILITKSCPGSFECLFLLAKIEYLKGDSTKAMNTLENILAKVDNSQTDVHLLMAQIQVQNGLFDRASQSLETCVSNNFKVRENPIYHYITGLVDKHLKNDSDAVKSLTTALTLINSKASNTSYKDSNSISEVSLSEKASIYIELIDALNVVGQTEESAKILEEATEELKGTSEEARILLLSADHAIERRNVQNAIDLLSRINSNEPYYMEAKMKHADILLRFRRDKYAYVACYEDLLKDNPGSDSYVLLGDAYMTVLEPDDALSCYEKALNENPTDPKLTSKMGKALVATHYFSRAVSFYKETINATNDPELKIHLAELYMNLKEYDKAELLLLAEVDHNVSGTEDLTYLQFRTRLLVLLALIQEKSGNVSEALVTLKNAKDCQNRVRKRLLLEHSAAPQNEINTLVDIGLKLAEISIFLKNNEQAISQYKDALEVAPDNPVILGALAKLYMQMNYLELCQQICSQILKIDPENENASVMMADIAFRKVDFDMALFHFTQLITKQPTNWAALVRLVEVLRRTGNIEDCSEYLQVAERNCENAGKDAGFLFCTALYQWYSGNLNGALRNFNSARQDAEYGQQAIYNMIEICLNPDDEMLAEQFMDSEDIEYRDSRSMALKTADRLLKELKQRLESNGDEILKYKLLSNFRLLATKEKYNIERALEDSISLASQNAYKDHIGVTLAIATAYTLLKQQQRAKNQLKRVTKTAWTFEDAEYLERCWLLLADFYIQSAKFDIATDLINKVVQHNKACMKAHEYLGFISEKEQRYKDAVISYENAWKFGGKSNPTIGFKLAYNLMKSKRYPDAIDMAQEVLKLNQDYPRVKKDILDKSMNNLRT